eukprot:624093-Alexandrium_andersonii.AAC.1
MCIRDSPSSGPCANDPALSARATVPNKGVQGGPVYDAVKSLRDTWRVATQSVGFSTERQGGGTSTCQDNA